VGTAREGIPYSSLLLLGAGMSTDWSSQLDGLWDAMATAVLNVYDAYGWVIPALLLSIVVLVLLVGVLGLLASIGVDDLPVDADVFGGVGGMFRGIFRWTHENWRAGRGGICTLELSAHKGSSS
jgi:hypothetical protein